MAGGRRGGGFPDLHRKGHPHPFYSIHLLSAWSLLSRALISGAVFYTLLVLRIAVALGLVLSQVKALAVSQFLKKCFFGMLMALFLPSQHFLKLIYFSFDCSLTSVWDQRQRKVDVCSVSHKLFV